MHYSYSFEARSIQQWIMAGGRMADMVAASAIVDQLCNAPLDALIEQLDIADTIRFARRAGGVFIALSQDGDALRQLRDGWSLLVPLLAPDLEAVHALAEGPTEYAAVTAVRPLLAAARNRPQAALPPAGPLTEREARTGLPAQQRIDRGSARKRGFASAATVCKRAVNDEAVGALGAKLLCPELLRSRRAEGLPELVWPLNLERSADADEEDADAFAFPFGDIDQIGVLHANGNGLGKVLIRLEDHFRAQPEGYRQAFRAFSDGLEETTLAAAQDATRVVLVPAAVEGKGRRGRVVARLPARPLVLGGDDLTIIVRGDLAWRYAAEFASAFERHTERFLREWAATHLAGGAAGKLPLRRLTASAGLVFAGANQPFHMAYEAAEHLCGFAKKRGDGQTDATGVKPGAIAFARITTSLDDEAGDPFASAIRVEGGEPARMSLGAYRFDPGEVLPSVDALSALCQVLSLPEMARGPARRLLNTLELDPREARLGYARWREIMHKRLPHCLQAFDAALAAFGPVHDSLPLVRGDWGKHDGHDVVWATPLTDAQRLIAVDCKFGEGE